MAIGVGSAPAGAQEAAPPPSGQATTLEEVVVTTEKRSENIQQVPIAVTAFTATQLQDKGVTDIHSLTNFTPNVNLDAVAPFSGSSSVLSASIRGIGQDDFAFNLDPGVGVYVDGVYLARTVGANQNLLDVQSVEISKGPQGTLFGRNTIGGAISIITRTPGDQFTFEGQVTGGSFDRRDIAVTADIPISDTLLSSITVSSQERDGYQKIVPYPGNTGVVDPQGTFHASDFANDGDTKGGQNEQSLRTKFLWKAADDLKITFTGDWTHDDTSAAANTVVGIYGGGGTFYDIYNACIAGVNLGFLCQRSNEGGPITSLFKAPGRVPYSAALVQTGNIDTTYANGNNFSKMDSFGGSVTADWTLADNFALKAITGYRRIDWKVGLDQDGSTLQVQEPSFSEGQHQFSEEVQALGTLLDGKLNYVGGLYYFNEGGFIHDYVTFPLGLLQVDGLNVLDTSSYAGYFHSNYKVTDQIGITVGARYSYEHKEFEGGQTDWNGFSYRASGCEPPEGSASVIGGPAGLTCQQFLGFATPGQPYRYFPAGQNTQDFYEFTPTAGAEYHFTDDLMSYFSWSKGFKTGGWTTRLSSPIPLATDATFGPEKAETYEVGLKSEWLNDRLVINTAGFYTEYSQIQLNQQIGASPVTKNLGSADILGAELEAHALITDGFTLSGSVGYIDAYYTALDPSAIAAVGPPVIPLAPGATSAAAQPLSLGSKLPKTPKWKFSISPEYDFDLANQATLRFLGDYTHTSSMFNDSLNTPQLRRPTTDVVNASVQYVSPEDRYEVIVGGTNITDDRYIVTGSTNTAAGQIDGTYDAPAEWYITLRAKFAGEKPSAPYNPPPTPVAAPAPAPVAAAPEAQRSFQVFFDFDKSDITSAAAAVIQKAADAVKAGNVVKITVTGHTDTVGSAKYNQGLSERRAAAVKGTLVSDGVAAGEITTIGVGKTGLLVPTADGVREPQNRRAEIVLQ